LQDRAGSDDQHQHQNSKSKSLRLPNNYTFNPFPAEIIAAPLIFDFVEVPEFQLLNSHFQNS